MYIFYITNQLNRAVVKVSAIQTDDTWLEFQERLV